MQSPMMPREVDLLQGGYSSYEPCMKFRFLLRLLPRKQDDNLFLVQRVTNITDLKKELPHASVKEVTQPVCIDYMNTKRYLSGPGKVVQEAVPSPPFKQTIEVEYALSTCVADLGEQVGDRRHADILLLDPAGMVSRVIKFKFDRHYLTIPDLDYSKSALVTRKLILCDVSEFTESLPNSDAYVIYKQGAAERMFEDKFDAEEWLSLDARSDGLGTEHAAGISQKYQVYRKGELQKLRVATGGDRLFIVD